MCEGKKIKSLISGLLLSKAQTMSQKPFFRLNIYYSESNFIQINKLCEYATQSILKNISGSAI
jgi:hypothetical protein